MNHRRHTKESIQEALRWGSDAARAAHIHIMADEHEIPTRERILGRCPEEDLHKIKPRRDGGV